MSVSPTRIWSADPPCLLASRFRTTGVLRFPPLPTSSPLAASQEIVPVGTVGRVYSYTVIHPNPKSGAAPFALGYVDLPGPVRLFGRITGEVAIGANCEATPHAEYGYTFHVNTTR